jgi:hypothetical protein
MLPGLLRGLVDLSLDAGLAELEFVDSDEESDHGGYKHEINYHWIIVEKLKRSRRV